MGGNGMPPHCLADPLTKEPQELPDLSIARFHSGGAGLVSTAPDYLSFAQFLLEGACVTGATCLAGRPWSTCSPISFPRGPIRAGWKNPAGIRIMASVWRSRCAAGAAVWPASALLAR